MKAFPEVRKNFYELFFKKWGKLSYMDFYCFRQRYEDEINFLQLFKEISSDYYKENEYLDNQKRAIIENSPWFMKLRVNLKYPTNRSKRESFRLNEEWLLFLLEDKKTFLIYRKDGRDYKYITEHSVNYGVLDYDVYKDFLVILSEDKFLRVIYLWTLGEVYERKNENIKGLYVSGDDLIIEYEGICQKAEILESGEVDFKDFVKSEREKLISAFGFNSLIYVKDLGIENLKHYGDVYSVSFSPDGKLLASGSNDNTIKIWEVGSWKLIKTLEGHSSYVYSVSFSPDGKLLASGSGDKTIKIWEVGSWELIKTLEGHSSGVYSVSFSPDGKFLVSGSWDKTIKIWEVGSWKLIKTLKGHSSGVLSVSFSPNGNYLASGGSDGLIRIWEFSLVSSYNDIKLVKALYYLYKKPNLFFYCEDKSIRSWSENKNEFEFSALIGENVEKVPDDYNEIKDFEVWIIDNVFIILKDNKVFVSENSKEKFKNYINVLLGTYLEDYLNFEEFLKLNIREVIK